MERTTSEGNSLMRVRLTGGVMAHPRRMETALKLIQSTPEGFLNLVLDPEPERPVSLRTAMRAWSSIPSSATHHLVLEDDATLSAGFVEHAERAAASAPDAAIAFYANWHSRNGGAVRLGALAHARWVTAVAEYTPTVALLLPAEVGAGFPRYARDHGGNWADDVVMSRYLRSIGVPTLLTVPNLVQHGDLPSLSGNDFHGLRLAACFSDMPRDTDWSLENRFDPDVVPYFDAGITQCHIRYPDRRWRTIASGRFVPRLGIDAADCRATFNTALESTPSLTPWLDRHLPHKVLAEFWQAAYVLGVLGRRCGRDADIQARLRDWNDDPLVGMCLATLGPGGLCRSLGAADLLRLTPVLDGLAYQALRAGAARDGRRSRTRNRRGVPAARARSVVVTPAGQPLTRCLVADLADRGHLTQEASTDAVAAGLLTQLSPGAHTLVCVEDMTDPGALTTLREHMREIINAARQADIGHVMFLNVSTIRSKSWAQTGPMDSPEPVVSCIDLGTPYGPELYGYSPVNTLVDQALNRQPMAVDPATPPAFHLVHAWDIADLIDRLLRSKRPSPVSGSIANGLPVSLRQLADVIAEVVHPVDIDIPWPEAPVKGQYSVPPTPETIGVPGLQWNASMKLAEGIRTVAQWWAYEAEGHGVRGRHQAL
jgi:hypothetical protein